MARRRLSRAIVTISLLGISLAGARLEAQERPDPGRVFSLNPFALLWGYVSAEYEQRVSPTLAVAVAGSYIDWDDNRYSNVDIKARLYPNERALNGFGLAASAGVTNVRSRDIDFICDEFECESLERTRKYTSPSVAVEITYQWLLGTQRATSINVGVGLKRLLTGSRTLDGDQRFLPTGRINVGYAF